MPSPWAACADPCFGAPDHEAGDAIENNDPADRTRLEDHLGYLQKTTRDELAHSDITLYKKAVWQCSCVTGVGLRLSADETRRVPASECAGPRFGERVKATLIQNNAQPGKFRARKFSGRRGKIGAKFLVSYFFIVGNI